MVAQEKNKWKKMESRNVFDKPFLTLVEASEYTGIGVNKLRDISNDPNCNFVLFVGKKRMFKRERLIQYLDNVYSV